MSARALVVGGTGPTGPFITQGLEARGYEVTLFHRGSHELVELEHLEHIHGDPHFAETIDEALGQREFDLVIATYGRTRLLAQHLAGRCARFIGIGGSAVYPGWVEPDQHVPFGMRLFAREDDPLEYVTEHPTKAQAFANKLIETERTVFELHDRGRFAATWFRYPRIYGPRNPMPYEWSAVRRIRDQRPFILLHDGGLQIRTRCAVRNAAHSVLLAVDKPHAAAGQIYNVGDSYQASERQWVGLIALLMEADLPVLSLPIAMSSPSWYLTPFQSTTSPHCLFDTTKIRQQLGYEDAIGTLDALTETIEWLVGQSFESSDYSAYQDTFDYALEDALVASYEHAMSEVEAAGLSGTVERQRLTHAYAHPTKAGAKDELGR
jgi:nucleoside-diphosphate-sugar epimerase